MDQKHAGGFVPAAIKPYLIAVGAGALVTAVLLLLFALLMTAVDMPSAASVALSTVAAALGALVSGFTAAKLKGCKGLVNGLIAGGILFAVILVISMCVSTAQFTMLTPARLIVCLLMAGIGGVMGVNMGRKRKMI